MKLLDKDGLTYYTSKIKNELTDYVKNTDYASASKGGVIKYGYGAYVSGSNGYIMCPVRTYTQYQTDNDQNFIGKGTLENVITGKGLITNTVNNLTNYYTKTEIDNTVGNIESILETLDIGSGV